MTQEKNPQSVSCHSDQTEVTTILDAIKTGVVILDKQLHTVIEANPTACRLMGIHDTEVVGQTCYNVVCRTHDTTGVPSTPTDSEDSERFLINTEGQEIPVIESVTEIRYQNRDCLVCTFMDITEQVQAKRKAFQASTEWRTTFDSISDMLSIHDRHCRIKRVNRALANAMGTTPQELLGKKCHDIFHGSPHVLPTCPAKRSFHKNRDAHIEFYEPHLNKYLGISTSPIKDENGDIVGAVHIAKDITEAKKAQDELVRMNEKLKEVDQLKSEFVSITSHELRTPLSVILGALKLLKDEIPGPMVDTQHQVVQTAMENVQRLARIVDDLLDVSKIEAGKLELQSTPTKISTLACECVDMYQHLAQEHEIHLLCKANQEDPPMNVDPDRIRQVINNLISNSLKFTPPQGKITVQCCVETEQALISIQDTGRGIDEKDIPHLFDKFTQFGKRKQGTHKGTGLGLAICKGIVEQHGGTIWIESELNKGTTSFISLPSALAATTIEPIAMHVTD